MADLLFKLLKRKTPLVAEISPAMLDYELHHSKYAVEIKPLASKDIEIGLEIEVEGISDEDIGEEGAICQYGVWSTIEDHSLRDSGIEFVSVSIAGERIHYALNQIYDCLPETAHFSPRTSIHVHVNALDLTPSQVAGMTIVFCAFEKLIYQWIGGDRDNNNFCVPFYKAKSYYLINSFLKKPWGGIPIGENHRYLGLNLHAIGKFGSVEFRQLGGTFDKEKIINWINVLFCIKQYAAKTDVATILQIVNELNTTSAYIAFYNDVFGTFGKILNPRNLIVHMEECVSYLKDVSSPKVQLPFNVTDWWFQRAQELLKLQVPLKIEFNPTLVEDFGRGRPVEWGAVVPPPVPPPSLTTYLVEPASVADDIILNDNDILRQMQIYNEQLANAARIRIQSWQPRRPTT